MSAVYDAILHLENQITIMQYLSVSWKALTYI